MELSLALELVRRESEKSSQARIAKRIGVHPSALTRWKQGEEPQGELRERLLAWAQTVASPEPIDVMREAVRQTGENLTRLAEIKGMADAVLQMLRGVTDQQQRVVDSLAPWSMAEGQVIAAQQLVVSSQMYQDVVNDATAHVAKQKAARRAQDAPSIPPKKKSGGR